MAAVAQPTKQAVVFPEVIEETRQVGDKITTSRYALGKILGKGGFAHCLVGVHIPTKKQYAIKIVSKSALEKAKARQKLQSEIRIHRTLNHQHVVHFDHYFEDTKYAFIVLELCHHNSMSELMRRRSKLTEPEVRYYLTQLVNALHFLHLHLIIHRDLKLGNLFLDKNLNLKVGDFGLAARLGSADERRRTVCGTPNYIAPEILEGKDGHSFEVDIWSTGVIMYTLLVGKPPFESSDVKTTYNRILSNQFSFPPSAMVCDHAENLIRHLLQPRADNRPKLDRILQHTFFTRLSALTPTSLPVSCLREPYVAANPKCELEPIHIHINDENDPSVINRQAAVTIGEQRQPLKAAAFSAPSTVISSHTQPIDRVERRAFGENKPVSAAIVVDQQVPRRPAVPARSTSANSGSITNSAKLATGPTSMKTQHAFDTNIVPESSTVSHKPVTRAQSIASATAMANKRFEVFADGTNVNPVIGKITTEKHSPSGVIICPEKRPLGGYPTGGFGSVSTAPVASVANSSTVAAPKRVATSSEKAAASEASSSAAAMDFIQSNLEGVRLSSDRIQARRPTTAASSSSSSSVASSSSAATTRPSTARQMSPPSLRGTMAVIDEATRKPVVVAWSHEATAANMKPSQRYLSAFQSTVALTDHAQPIAVSPQTHQTTASEHAFVPSNKAFTPPEQIQPARRDEKGPLHTLEQMHDALINVDDSLVADKQIDAILSDDVMNLNRRAVGSMTGQAASVWVVRYVDYTSKYGLGFLLNTGSAGVYFNDSTKIVLSADGTVFQYIERKRRDNVALDAYSEYTCQTHLITRYPVELQKKVTLLCHFRSYLIDQQAHAKSVEGSAEDNGTGCHLEASSKVAGATGAAEIVSGACPDVIMGVSSAVYSTAGSASSARFQNYMSTSEPEQDLPFLKKWIKTRHAIMFRLSNRTVQIVFFDRSEILLSSEARVVTYVTKTGDRSEHSLEDVLQSGRKDISKRLKYTKDILHRLINIQR